MKYAAAIKEVESGGNCNLPGKSKERGCFQFISTTWTCVSRQMTGSVLPMTPGNEEYVATLKIEELHRKGYTLPQIAKIWNGSLCGSEKPVAKQGVNSHGVAFDTVLYALKVQKAHAGQ